MLEFFSYSLILHANCETIYKEKTLQVQMTNSSTCPICKATAQRSSDPDGRDRYIYNCDRCGEYSISGSAVPRAESLISGSLSTRLSGWLREQNLYGKDSTPVLTVDAIERLEKELPNYSPLEKQDKLLKAIEKLTKHPGHGVNIAIDDSGASLAWARNSEELRFYIKALEERGLVIDISVKVMNMTRYKLMIASEGWNYLASKPADIESKTQVFVAMSFDKDLDSVYQNAIKPAIEETGYTPYRVDKEPHNEKIDMKIIAEILNSRFVIADVTEQNSGVYYEAGFAYGRNIPVIWSVNENDLEKVHFDTRQYAHIVWKDKPDLKNKLQDHIRAIIGTKSPGT